MHIKSFSKDRGKNAIVVIVKAGSLQTIKCVYEIMLCDVAPKTHKFTKESKSKPDVRKFCAAKSEK